MTLAEDLVTAAAQAMSRTATTAGYRLREKRAPLAKSATAAVLRRVVAELRAANPSGSLEWDDAYGQAANDFEMLADEIEGGSRG